MGLTMKALTIAALVASSPAIAQECIPTVDAYISLSQNYGEKRVLITVLPDGRIVETWINPDTETWSMMITLPNGLSCGIGSGIGFALNGLDPNV